MYECGYYSELRLLLSSSKDFCSETFDDVILDLRVEVPAPAESSTSNTLHAVRYVDAGQRLAPGKRRVSNSCHTVWYVDAGQRFAIGVSIIS